MEYAANLDYNNMHTDRRSFIKSALTTTAGLLLPSVTVKASPQLVDPICHKLLAVQPSSSPTAMLGFLMRYSEVNHTPKKTLEQSKEISKEQEDTGVSELLKNFERNSTIPKPDVGINKYAVALREVTDLRKWDRSLLSQIMLHADRWGNINAGPWTVSDASCIMQIASNRIAVRNRRYFANKAVVNPANKKMLEAAQLRFKGWSDDCEVMTHPDIPYHCVLQVMKGSQFWDAGGFIGEYIRGVNQHRGVCMPDLANYAVLNTIVIK